MVKRSSETKKEGKTDSWFKTWMMFCLYFCCAAQIGIGSLLIVFFDVAYWGFGSRVTGPAVPVQLLGVFYLARGFACGFAARDPARKSILLLPVLFSMIGCSLLWFAYFAIGRVHLGLSPIAVLGDFLFVPVLWHILAEAGKNQPGKDKSNRRPRPRVHE